MKIKKEHRNLLIAMSIGDGYLNKNGYLDIWHSPKQKEFVDYKYDLIRMFCNIKPEVINRSGFNSYGFRTKSEDFLKLLRRIIYKNGKKNITRKILNRLNALGVAIWYMDDGHINIRKTGDKIHGFYIKIATCEPIEQVEIIINYFKEVWDVSF